MADDFGPGVSRTLSAIARAFTTVIHQRGKPILDADLNLMSQIYSEEMREFIRSQVHSGWFTDPTAAVRDFVTDSLESNQFFFGQQKLDDVGVPEEIEPVLWANVNGWIVPVAGTQITTTNATSNRVRLNPPPDSDARIDLVFLEVWKAQIAPNPSTNNKPAADKIWKWGNAEYGGVNIDDDIEDPTFGYEITERAQLQYRIRVFGSGSGGGSSVALDVYPDGIDDPNVTAQGPRTTPGTFTFSNMREDLGDPSLWRAGDGDPTNELGTIDGYVYGVPIAAVFRRNTQPWVTANISGNPNQNGSFDRNPSAQTLVDPRDGAKTFLQARLVNDMGADQFTVDTEIEVDSLVGSGIDDPNLTLTSTFLVIDNEIMSISAVNTAVVPARVTIPAQGRGRNATDIVTHTGRVAAVVDTGTPINFFNSRDDGLFADEIAASDILDLRRSLAFGDWDYQRILLHNIAALAQNRLHSTWKTSGVTAGDTEGTHVVEVDYMFQDGATAVPNGTEALDGPDGIRTIWSDAAALQSDVTLMLDNDAPIADGFVVSFDGTIDWDVGADFKPSGFMNNSNGAEPGFKNGTTLFLYIGGDDGSQGARKTFRDGATRAVRFVAPQEYFRTGFPETDPDTGRQFPVYLRWVSNDDGLTALSPAAYGETVSEHPGPMYPLQTLGFERPFIVLGGVLNSALIVQNINTDTDLDSNVDVPTIPLGEGEIVLSGFNFDTPGDWFTKDANGNFVDDPNAVTFALLRDQRTLWSMLTRGGKDITGSSSEVYVILYGDKTNQANNGVFRVVGAGNTAGYTTRPASAADRVRVEFLTIPFQDFVADAGENVTAQFRSQYMNSEDGAGYATGPSAAAIVLTDLDATVGGSGNPWNSANLATPLTQPFNDKLIINCTIMYHPGRGGTARVADEFSRIAIQGPSGEYVRQAPANIDTAFPGEAGTPGNPVEIFFDFPHIQTWNRLSSLGLHSPDAPNYGGNIVASSEQDREAECLVDPGSKTIMIRPMQRELMTVQAVTTDATPTLIGDSQYPAVPTKPESPPPGTAKDGAGIWTVGLKMGYAIPPEFMPRFGRQDIPYYQDNGPAYGAGNHLEGINHLFNDNTDLTSPVFYIIGGEDNPGPGNLVTSMFFQTGSTSGFKYGEHGTIVGPGTPAYQARLTTEIGTSTTKSQELTTALNEVISSDVGRGLRGIMLPPYMGIARVYGVYDRRDFVNVGGDTYDTDRVTPLAGNARNLLIRDSKKQSLFIFEDGAKDITDENGDHTYIIPSDVIDITKSPFWVSGENFEDLEYVVECQIFGFSKYWINGNNFVLARRNAGDATNVNDGDNPELESIPMTLLAPVSDSDRLYAAYNRTVYQGDPFMSRAGGTRTTSDYVNRYGQIPVASMYELNTAIQQFDANGETIPETVNARTLQVLASVNFYTTLGTGNVGGKLFPGTITDVGFTENTEIASTRLPETVGDPAFRILTRAFTEGQKTNTSRAGLELEIIGNNTTITFLPDPNATKLSITRLDATVVEFSANNGPTAAADEFDASSPDPAVIARELFTKINDRGELDQTLIAENDLDAPVIRLIAVPVGTDGNGIKVSTNDVANIELTVPKSGEETLAAVISSAFMAGGEDLALNAGSGTTQLVLTGMTERLPMGILLQDSDFLGENPLQDNSTAMRTRPVGFRPVQSLLPLTRDSGEEYTRFMGDPGEFVGNSDGGINLYQAYTDNTPGGSKRFRLFRGGGSAHVMTGPNPGGPIDWDSESLPAASDPVLKGGLLACKALLVRNFTEVAFNSNDTTNEGDEIQMVIITHGILGDGNTVFTGIDIEGIISPTGYGEGYAAADRYRLEGKPMYTGRVRTPPETEDVDLALYPGRENE